MHSSTTIKTALKRRRGQFADDVACSAENQHYKRIIDECVVGGPCRDCRGGYTAMPEFAPLFAEDALHLSFQCNECYDKWMKSDSDIPF
jgi:hypothetical protein